MTPGLQRQRLQAALRGRCVEMNRMSDVLDLTSELIAAPSVTPDDAGCQAVLAERLQRAGFRCEHLRFGEVDNLWATHGSGAPVLVLLGHTDVVPSGPREAWTQRSVRSPTIRDGVLYGRGAADMKGSVAAFVVALERFVAAHPDHPGRVALLLTSRRGRRRHRRRAPRRRDLPRTRRAHRLVHHRRTVVDSRSSATCCASAGAARLSATLTVRGVQGHVAYPDKARNPDPPGDAGAGRTRRATLGRGLRDASRRPACRSATSTPAPVPTT